MSLASCQDNDRQNFQEITIFFLFLYNLCPNLHFVCLIVNNFSVVETGLPGLFVLLLYVPSQQLWSLRDGLFLGRLEQAVNQ